jgi:hypothetical protein
VLSSDIDISGTINCRKDQLVDMFVLVQEPDTSDVTTEQTLLKTECYLENTLEAPLWTDTLPLVYLPSSDYYTTDEYTGPVEYRYYIEEVVPNGYSALYDYTIDGETTHSENGYELCPDDLIGKDNVVTITNMSQEKDVVTLPNTGGRGTIVYTIAGWLTILLAACCLYIKFIGRGGVDE